MSEQKAEELIRAAEKKMASGQGFFSSMFSDPNRKTEEAAELAKEMLHGKDQHLKYTKKESK